MDLCDKNGVVRVSFLWYGLGVLRVFVSNIAGSLLCSLFIILFGRLERVLVVGVWRI